MLNRLLEIFEWKKIRVIFKYAVYMLLVMLLQSLLFSRVSILGAKGFVIPAAAVAAGLYLGGVRGAVFGIFLGLFTDMALSETTVLFTLLFPLIGFGADGHDGTRSGCADRPFADVFVDTSDGAYLPAV